jgi:MSHA biogenesis protein MshJ
MDIDFKQVVVTFDLVNARSLRERAIIATTLAVVTSIVFFELYWSPWLDTYKQTSNEILVSTKRTESLLATLTALSDQMEADPNQALQSQKEQLNQQVASQEDQLREMVSQLVRPTEMVDLLYEVLRDSEGVELIELSNLAVERIFGAERDRDTSDKNVADSRASRSRRPQEDVSLYRHQVKLEFEAGFFDTLAYMNTLESLGDRLIFKRLEYRVTEYPMARIILIVETLGMNKEWLSV